MYINSLGMGGVSAHTQRNRDVGTSNINQYNYDTAMQKAMQKRNAAIGAASASDGDMIITQPSYYQKNSKQQYSSEREKNAMTMSEYRQWFRSEVAGIQSDAYTYSPYLSDTLVIKEETFEKMRSDPEWEKEVLSKIKEHCCGKNMAGTKAIGYQIIGASQDACHEEGIPVRTNASTVSSLYTANPLLTQSGYWNTMLTGQTGLSNYLTQGLLYGQSGLGTLAQAAYSNVLNGGSSGSLLGNFLI
ncbi:MAG: hypothetical protein HDR27_03410 [Lachnospiraceae bacterium]|nr:hypothetical protein [Lachnospiraceae bacterium]